MRDLSKSYIWYTKDWKADERVFNLSLAERGLYRELIDLCYAQQNRVPIDLQKWARMYNSTPLEIEKILTHLEVNLLVQIRS